MSPGSVYLDREVDLRPGFLVSARLTGRGCFAVLFLLARRLVAVAAASGAATRLAVALGVLALGRVALWRDSLTYFSLCAYIKKIF